MHEDVPQSLSAGFEPSNKRNAVIGLSRAVENRVELPGNRR